MKWTYRPTAIDVAWARNVTQMLSEGGVWGWPATGLIYRIDKKRQELVLVNPEILSEGNNAEMHYRSFAVFKEVGYMVLPATPDWPKAICDFCSDDKIVISYPSKDIISGVFPLAKSLGAWAACSACRDLIEADKWKELEDRSVRKFIENNGEILPVKFLREFIQDLHGQFRASRIT